jgi:hypothetical protein
MTKHVCEKQVWWQVLKRKTDSDLKREVGGLGDACGDGMSNQHLRSDLQLATCLNVPSPAP